MTLQVHLPDELARNPKLRTYVTLHTPGLEAPDEIFADDKAYTAWALAPERAALISPMPHHMLSKGADGVWTGGDIAPGQYTLKSRATVNDEANQEFKLLGVARRMGITISAEAVGTTVDLGELKIEPVVPK